MFGLTFAPITDIFTRLRRGEVSESGEDRKEVKYNWLSYLGGVGAEKRFRQLGREMGLPFLQGGELSLSTAIINGDSPMDLAKEFMDKDGTLDKLVHHPSYDTWVTEKCTAYKESMKYVLPLLPEMVQRAYALRPTDQLQVLDIGGGTGKWTKSMIDQIRSKFPGIPIEYRLEDSSPGALFIAAVRFSELQAEEGYQDIKFNVYYNDMRVKHPSDAQSPPPHLVTALTSMVPYLPEAEQGKVLARLNAMDASALIASGQVNRFNTVEYLKTGGRGGKTTWEGARLEWEFLTGLGAETFPTNKREWLGILPKLWANRHILWYTFRIAIPMAMKHKGVNPCVKDLISVYKRAGWQVVQKFSFVPVNDPNINMDKSGAMVFSLHRQKE